MGPRESHSFPSNPHPFRPVTFLVLAQKSYGSYGASTRCLVDRDRDANRTPVYNWLRFPLLAFTTAVSKQAVNDFESEARSGPGTLSLRYVWSGAMLAESVH
jgi:hypothetical protein